MSTLNASGRISRRSLLALPLLAAGPAPSVLPVGLRCKVFRAGRQIGEAAYGFSRQDGLLQVKLDVALSVRMGFITLFRYTHHNAEQWRDDRLVWFAARTRRNGETGFAQASWNGSGLAVTGSGTKPYVAPARAIGTSYWNIRTLTDPLIDSQNGRLLQVTIAPIGPNPAIAADGARLPALKYRMTGDVRMDLWYAQSKLAGLAYFAHDGSVLTYEKI